MPNITPKTAEEIMENAVGQITAVFEGYVTGITRTYEQIHPEIKDEFSLVIRSAMQSLLRQAIEEMPEIDGKKGLHGEGYHDGVLDCIIAIKSLQERI